MDCCVNRTCWCFTSKGMCNVGQDEIVFVLEVIPDEEMIPLDILRHFYTIYEEAGKGIHKLNISDNNWLYIHSL